MIPKGNDLSSTPESIVRQIADQFAQFPQVAAVVLAGSQTAYASDPHSDIDLYVYMTEQIPLSEREKLARTYTTQPQLDNHFWEDGDEWIADDTGIAVDVMYRSPRWIEEQLQRVLAQHQASVGYSTAFWFNVRNSKALYDRNGWYAALQQRADQPYPEALRLAVVAKNYPILRLLRHSAYQHQLEHALRRGDLVSIQHRMTAVLTSYFDILFAVNRELHPGEKRLTQYAARLPRTPEHFADDVQALITSVCAPEQTMPAFHRLMDRLDELLEGEGLLR